eukprot:COSAG05_NODE_14745_length_388_cov_0.733564_2_plen_99_part_01
MLVVVSLYQILGPHRGFAAPTQRTNAAAGGADDDDDDPDDGDVPPRRVTDTGVYLRETSSGGMVSSTGLPSARLAGTPVLFPSPVSNMAGVDGAHCDGL